MLVSANKYEVQKFRAEFQRGIESFIRNSNKSGYITAPCGAGKTFTCIKALMNTMLPDDVLFVTSRRSIVMNNLSGNNREILLHTRYGSRYFKLLDEYQYNDDKFRSPFYIYDTLVSMCRQKDENFINTIKSKKLIVCDEATSSGSSTRRPVFETIKQINPSIRLIGCSLFSYRPMDEADKDELLELYDNNCVITYEYADLQKRGVLPKIKYIRALSSIDILYQALKDRINPSTQRCYTKKDCSHLIHYRGIATVDSGVLSERFMQIAKRENWTNLMSQDKCIHVMTCSYAIRFQEANTMSLVEKLCDTLNVPKEAVEVSIINGNMPDIEVARRLDKFNTESDSSIKIKILSGVGMLTEGLHTAPEIDLMVNNRGVKAVYTAEQLCGRLSSQNFSHQPYFIDCACTASDATGLFQDIIDDNRKDFTCRLEESFAAIGVDCLDMEEFVDDASTGYLSPSDTNAVIQFAKDRAGVLYDKSNLVYSILTSFNHIAERGMMELLHDTGLVE